MLIAMLALQAATPSPAPQVFDLRSVVPPARIAAGCDTPDDSAPADDVSGDVLVCGGRDLGRHRLPLPQEREPDAGPVRGELPHAAAALGSAARCGIFAGERRCGKKEAARYGYGEGRDPITALGDAPHPDRRSRCGLTLGQVTP